MVSGGCHQRRGSNAIEVVGWGAVGPIVRPWLLGQGKVERIPNRNNKCGQALGSAKTHTTTARARENYLVPTTDFVERQTHMLQEVRHDIPNALFGGGRWSIGAQRARCRANASLFDFITRSINQS